MTTFTVTLKTSDRCLLVCTVCRSNTKPRLVWTENGYLCYAGKKIREDLSTGVMQGHCPWCNREWRFQKVRIA